ncbi:MAG: FAD-dependent oxidoreductase [Lachnospiraceae bacterium]|jgi:NADPH-dependent 2,4-dienoyl-CoA reductase/sulfur reductase-like enzyme|nr:FAD-dependent oxidoreductase [Lachnospiraceae bacterium]
MKTCELIIIGGGGAGMAAAIGAWKKGVRDILILEREEEPGGILLQCIHNGFGLHTFGEELTGPSYAERFLTQTQELGICIETGALVLHLHSDKTLSYISPASGYVSVQARAIILAMGCRERPRGAIGIPGTRPFGIWTAGTAQRYLNLDGILPGRRVFILGSGDIGLIMARRMTLEGAAVLGVAELLPYSNGLPRNQKQCLEDFGIPLYLSHTVTEIRGQDRLREVVVSRVDESHRPIPGTQKVFPADTLLLSVGLIPENSLSEEAGIALHPRTRGPVVDESFQTSLPGVFACGNVLHVHDLVDFVSAEGMAAGEAAARFLFDGSSQGRSLCAAPADETVGYVLPQTIHPDSIEASLELKFRVTGVFRNATLQILTDGIVTREIRKRVMIPAEMEKILLKKEELNQVKESITIRVAGNS